jgi:hypothetical protein
VLMVMEDRAERKGSIERGTQCACEHITQPTSQSLPGITVNNLIGYKLVDVVSNDGCTKVQHSS